MLRLAGAELVQVPAVPYKNPNNYVRYSERLAERSLQPVGTATVQSGRTSSTMSRTGRRISKRNRRRRSGSRRVTGRSMGFMLFGRFTGGTLAGVGMKRLRARKPGVKSRDWPTPKVLAQSSDFYTTGAFNASEGTSITEGNRAGARSPRTSRG